MTQSLFDALTSGISTIENQSAIQSILESQTGAENASAQVDDEDLFQCGKCKKQFTSLHMFVNHKQGRCSLNLPRQTFQPSVLQGLNTGTLNGAVAQTIQKSPLTQTTLPSFTTVSQSTLNQLAPSVVLGEDQILTYSDLGTAVQNGIIQGSTLHLTGNTVQAAGPFLSQVAQLAPRPANSNVTIISPVQSTTTLAPSNGTTLTNPVSINSLQSLVQPTQQITLATPLPEIKPAGSNVVKPNIIKPGRKPGQGTVGGGGLDDADSSPRRRPRIGAAVGNDMGKKKLSCNYCGKEFTKNFDLQQHIRSHTGERPFQCVVCGRAFAQKSNVKKHMATHKVWPTGPGTTLPDQPPALLVPVDDCQKAEVTITTQALPEQPVQEQAPVQNDVEIITDKPEKQQITEETTQNYKVKVIIDNSYLCQYCPEKFKSYYQLKSHMVKHKNVQVYKCVVKNCGSVFKDLDAYLEHTTSHSDELTYRCHLCSKVFSSLYDLGVHQYSHSMYQHPSNKSGPRYFQCNKCLNKYSTPEALEHHINTTDHKFPCPHCQKNFTSERFLRRHLVFHGTEGQFECTVCQKTFKTEHYLKNHALIHTGEKPFECEICGAKFNRKDKLKRHNLIHDKRVRVKCPFKSVSGCDKEFNRPDKLKAHIITHSGIKPFACQICGKEFGRRPHLKEHEKAHREEYPYKCTKCNRGFFRPKLFKEHKCEDANGQIIRKRVFQPRRMKRKPGRPRKIVRKQGVEGNAIIINSTKKGGSERIVVQTAPAGHKIKKKQTVKISTPESAVVQETDSSAGNICETVISDKTEPISTVVLPEENMEIATLANTVSIPDTNVIDTAQELGTKGKKAKPECYVKAPPASMVPVSVVERYVTVHLTSTGQGDLSEMHAQLIPSGDFAGQLQFSTALQNGQIQISPPSSGTTYHPLHIIEGQPVTLTVSQQDHLNALGVNENDVIDIPVDIVTVSDDRGLVCSHEVTNTGDSGEQTYTIGDYGPEGDVVLQGSENLINGSVEILGHDQEAMVNLENE